MTAPAPSPIRARFFQHAGEELWSARTDSLQETDEVVAQCAAIEARAWRPREPVSVAYRRSDHLLWAARGGRVTGFVLVSILPARSGELALSIDEAMVEPEHVGEHVVSRLFWSAACGVTARRARKITFFALTSSPRLIRAFYKYRFLLPAHSFAPRPWLERAAAGYLERRGLEPLVANSFVWVKAAFPGGLRASEPGFAGASVPTPSGFDPHIRGDALLMVGAIPTALARPIALARHALLARNVSGRHVSLPW